MLPGLQYTDFHKFLVSIGGLVSAAGLALPIFLLRSQSSLLLTDEQLKKATPEAAAAVRSQQGQLAFLISAWPWVSLSLLSVGAILVIVGGRAWRKQQRRIETREEAEIEKIKAEGAKAQQETLALVQAQVATEEDVAEHKAEQEEIAEEKQADKNSVAEEEGRDHVPDRRERMISFENSVVERVSKHFGSTMQSVGDVKLGPGTIADAVLVSKVDDLPNILLEARLVTSPNPAKIRALVQDMVGWSLAATGKATQLFGTDFLPVIIIGVDGDEETTQQLRHIAAEEAARIVDYPKTLVLLLTPESPVRLTRIDAAPAAQKGIHVM
ncbi:hypothetical protein [Actinoplanes sp. NPDC026670]|uniref:hypothetical protein n=1 Tax=Actinoplanes sp. NPDC026670 TaxID=3154700 RepID=UPI0033ED1F38